MRYTELLEALDLKTAVKYRKLWNPDNNKNLFIAIDNKDNWNLSKNTFRLYKKLSSNTSNNKTSATKDKVENILSVNNYSMVDYAKGIARDSQNRNVKISKVLNRFQPDLLQKFNNDPIRQASKQNNTYIVISRHPYDVAGMSTDRGWESCMNLVDGVNNHYVDADIKLGTLIAYQITGTDLNINKPMGRILIKPLVSIDDPSDYVLVKANTSYGTVTDSFTQELDNFIDLANKVLGINTDGFYCLSDDLYDEVDNYYKGKLSLNYVQKNNLSKDDIIDYIKKNANMADDLLAYIMKDPELAYEYATAIIKGRWPEAEPYIMTDPEWAYLYARYVLQDRWQEAEPIIMKDPKSAYYYARYVLNSRWKEADPFIKGSYVQGIYEDYFRVTL